MTARTPRPAYPKHDWTPEIDARLQAAYRSGRRGDIKRLALDTGIPHNTLSNRAAHTFGLRRYRLTTACGYRWTQAEDAILLKWGHLPARLVMDKMAEAGFRRTRCAVDSRRRELRRDGRDVGANDRGDAYNVAEVAAGLGCNPMTIQRWITRGELRAKALLPDSQAGKHYRIRRADLRRFCIERPVTIARLEPDLIWLIDLIANP